MVIYTIVVYGGYMLWNKSNEKNMILIPIIVATFMFCAWVYWVGYTQDKYCFDPEKYVADQYHALMHIVGSVGHNLIMLL